MRGREKSRWLIRRFARDDAGAAFLIFALGIFLTLGAIALAFDLSRFFLAKTRLSFAIEIAAVAAAKSLPFADDAALATFAREMTRVNFASTDWLGFESDAAPVVTLATNRGEGTVTVAGQAAIPTLLLGALQFPEVTIGASVSARAEQPALELALVIEASAALAANGRLEKITEAAAGLIGALDAAFTAGGGAQYALVPFGNALVNVAPRSDWVAAGLWPENLPPEIPGTTGWSGDLAADRWCVGIRPGAAGEAATSPDLAPFPLVLTLTSEINPETGLAHFENITTSECRVEPLLPLGSAGPVASALASLTGTGDAAPGRAMLWAERLLSPDWRGFWKAGSSSPADYDDATRSKAVLLIAGSDVVDTAEIARLIDVCARLRGNNVALYIVDYLAPESVSSALQLCAGPPMHYFRAEDEAALQDALVSLAGFLIKVRFPGM